MDKILKDVINIVKKAGKEILKIYKKDYQIYKKKDGSSVTEADLISEKIILSGLKKYNYPILSEESKDDKSRIKKEKIWIVDPLDGTNDFLEKNGEFSIMIGLVYNKEPVLGVVYKPVGDKLYFAKKKEGAYLQEGKSPIKKIKVSNILSLSEANFVVSRSHFSKKTRNFLKKNNIKKVTQVGSTGVKIGLVAEGRADAYITLSNKTCQWDICAPEIILKEAGGKITNLKGKNLVYNRREIRNLNGVLAANKKIHNVIIKNT